MCHAATMALGFETQFGFLVISTNVSEIIGISGPEMQAPSNIKVVAAPSLGPLRRRLTGRLVDIRKVIIF